VQQMARPPLAPSLIVPHIPEHLELVVLKALEKRADHRYQRMDDMMLALQDPATYVANHGGAGGFLLSPVLRQPAQPGPAGGGRPPSRGGRPAGPQPPRGAPAHPRAP